MKYHQPIKNWLNYSLILSNMLHYFHHSSLRGQIGKLFDRVNSIYATYTTYLLDKLPSQTFWSAKYQMETTRQLIQHICEISYLCSEKPLRSSLAQQVMKKSNSSDPVTEIWYQQYFSYSMNPLNTSNPLVVRKKGSEVFLNWAKCPKYEFL